MGCHRPWHSGLRSKTEGQIRYRGLQGMGRRPGRYPACRAVAQYRGLCEGAGRRPHAFPAAAANGPAPAEKVLDLKEAVLKEAGSEATSANENPPVPPKLATQELETQTFKLQIDGCRAKFVPQWRVRIRR